MKMLVWDITSFCNLKCEHCYAYPKYRWRESDYSDKHLVNFTDAKQILFQAKAEGFNRLHLLGGEPLMRKDIIDVVSFAAKNLDMIVSLNTNGVALSLEKGISLVNAGIDSITLSLEGAQADTHNIIRGNNVFERAISNIKKLSEWRRNNNVCLDLIIGYCLTGENIKQLIPVYELANKLGLDGLYVDFLSDYGNAKKSGVVNPASNDDILDELIKLCEYYRVHWKTGVPHVTINHKPEVRRYLEERCGVELLAPLVGDNCPAGDSVFLMESDGIFTPCNLANQIEYNHSYVESGELFPDVINLKEVSVVDALNSDFNKQFIKIARNAGNRTELCRVCDFSKICSICPMEELDNPDFVSLCGVARKRRDDLKNHLLNVCWDFVIDTRKITADTRGRLVLDGLKDGKPPSVLIDELVKLGEDQSVTEAEMVSFLYKLLELKVIKRKISFRKEV